MKNCLFILICLFVFSSCKMVSKTTKNNLVDGFYSQGMHNARQTVYIDNRIDTIFVYSTQRNNESITINPNVSPAFFPIENKVVENTKNGFSKPSLDIDFLTIPLKFRPAQQNVPSQLNTNLNGAFYLGYRTDRYVLHYDANPLGKSERKVTHFGFSVGVFTGLGNTFISPTTTNNVLEQEYDGIAWSKGIAGIFAVNNFTVGLSFGFDHLLDKNHSVWVYQKKPWVGLAFGLNLN